MNNLSNSTHKKIPNITSLRFILAVFVILYHTPQFFRNRVFSVYDDLPIFFKGKEAVYVFFTLSGFLIIKKLFEEKKNSNSIDLQTFFRKRILRIFPLYYLVLIFGFLYYQCILPIFGFNFENNYDLLYGILLAGTFFSNVFKTLEPGGILEILWSIGIEEQFYIFIAPLFFFLPWRRSILFLSLFTLLYFTLYFVENLSFLREYSMLYFYFSFGGLISICLQYDFFLKAVKRIRLLVLIIFTLYFTTAWFSDFFNDIMYHLFSMILFGFTLLALAIQPIKVLENKVLQHLGKISYGVYMYHSIVLQGVGLFFLKYESLFNSQNVLLSILIYLIVICTTVIISHYSFIYYESYFLKMKKRMKS